MKHSIALLSLLVMTGTAHADNKEKADALFKQGKKQMGEKRYAEACESFEKSYKLDPGIGAQLNIAKCYEDWGKIGRAFVAYQAAEKQAHDAKDAREPKIHELVVAIEPNVPHLTIKVPKDAPPDFKVTLDGNPVTTFNDAMVIDPGPKTIEWWVKGSAKKSKVVAIARGGESEVTLDIPKVETKPGPVEKPVVPEKPEGGEKPAPADPGKMWKLGGMVLGGAGVVAIGVSSYLTLSARSRYKDALDMYCGGMTNNCDMMGLEITHDARHTANIATIVFFAGVAMAGGGAALYFLAPKAHEGSPPAEEQTGFYITPAISPDGAGIVLGGTL